MSEPRESRMARRRAAAPARGRATVVLGAVAVILALGTAADIFAAAEPSAGPPPVPQDPAAAGTWYCPSVGQEGERVVLTMAAVGDQPSQVVVDRYAGERPRADDPVEVPVGGSVTVPLEGDDATAPSTVRWTGGPVVATWRVDGDRTAAAPCETAPSAQWYVAGFNTVGESRATLHLFNPFAADAVVRLVFAKPDGRQTLALTDNILIPANGTRSLSMRKFQPEETDLGVVVEVLSGRLVVQGEQTIDSPQGSSGAAGRMALPAAPAPSDSWSFGYAADGEGTESWLTVLNPGNDEAAVEVRVSSPRQRSSNLVSEVTVPPGGLARIELAGVSREPEFGVTVNVINDEPVVAVRHTARSTGSKSAAVAGSLGAPQLSQRWALVGGGTAGRVGQVSLYNPGPEPAVITVSGRGAPPAWRGIQLGPNERATVGLRDAIEGKASAPVIVTADTPVVAELRSMATTGSALRLWMAVGVFEQRWIGPLTRPAVRWDPSLSTHAGTSPPPTEPGVLDDLEPLPGELPTAPGPAATAPATPAPGGD